MTRTLRIGVVMDPLPRVHPDKDTTFALMLEAQKRGHELWVVHHRDIFCADTDVRAMGRRAEVFRPQAPGEPHHRFHQSAPLALADLDAVWMRTDPPVDADYLYATHLLSLVEARGVFVMNRPAAIRDANEKLYALNFPHCIPRTLLTREVARLKEFLRELGGEMILKPPHGWGGLGIFLVHAGDRNLNAILETVTENGCTLTMAQQYIKAVRELGDERVLMLDGEPLGAVARVPREDEHRSNLHVGGTARKVMLGERERRICAEVGPKLREAGLYFVGLDIIGDYLTEVNVTSPTGIQEIDRLDGVCLETTVLELVERKAAEAKATRKN
ncbi:MAG: glutathione synthase [Deltaproteobacteria bacterium]|nr:glutathione synthase [Deltaproteobacteria bacterium]